MPNTVTVLDVSTVSIFAGDTWDPTRPEYDISRLAFLCFTSAGQLVQASPNGHVYYVHHGLSLLFPVNLPYAASFPVYWVDGPNNKRIPFLAAEHDFQPRFGGPGIQVNLENSYPVNPVLQVMGPAVDVHLFGGLSDDSSVEAQLQAAAMAVINAPRAPCKPVNAFIAYRCLYGPYIPLVRQMEISGIVRSMWQNENSDSKTKFSIAAKVYTLERDYLVSRGLPKVSLKAWLYNNCGRFQINSPEFHIIPHLIYTIEQESLIGYRQWIMDCDAALRNSYPSWATAPTAIDIFANRDFDIVTHGDEEVLNNYFSTLHFQKFNFHLAFAHLYAAINNPIPMPPITVPLPNNTVVVNNPVAVIAPPANIATNNAVATNP